MNTLRSLAQFPTPSIAAILSAAIFGMAGCSMGTVNPSGELPAEQAVITALQGSVHGGQQPVAGAKVQLYAAGTPAAPTSGGPTGGIGKGAVALLATPVTTDANGAWNITGQYTCPSSTAPVYIVATGGDPTGGTTIDNTYIALMASLGQCGHLGASTHVVINEITTVAAVWALQQFLAPPDGTNPASAFVSQGGSTAGVGVNIGASSGPVGGYGPDMVQTSVIGLSNAANMVDNLVDYDSGNANPRPTNTWANPYSAKILTLANIIAACINTDPSQSNLCSTFMSSAQAGSVTPRDTIQAAYLMAQNPTNNVVALTALASSTPPFGGGVAAPTDFTLEVAFSPNTASSTPALSSTVAGALDEYGRAWFVNLAPGSTPSVVELDANGKFLAGPFSTYTASGGYQATSGTYIGDPCASGFVHSLYFNTTGPKNIVIDQNNMVWVSNTEELVTTSNCNTTSIRSYMRLTGSGAGGTGGTVATGYYVNGTPYALAVDAANNVWTTTSSGKVISYAAGASTYASGATTIGSGPQGSAIDMLGNFWSDAGKACTGSATGVLYQTPVSSLTAPTITAGYYPSGATSCAGGTVSTAGAASTVTGIAADANNGIWAVNNLSGANTVTYFSPSSPAWTTTSGGTIAAAGALTSAQNVGGVTSPYFIAVDGSNHAWVANNSGTTLSELAVSLDASKNILSITSVPQPVTIGTTTNGYTFPNSSSPFQKGAKGIMIDPSGNVWILNSNTTTAIPYVTVVVGAATPVITPLTLQVKAGRVGQTPQ